MNILVTGSAGFIGSWLTDALETRGDTVTRFDIADDDAQDCANLHAISDAVAGHDLVVNAAVHIDGTLGEADPYACVAGCAGIAANVARACRDQDVHFVHLSSNEVYTLTNVYAWAKEWSDEIVNHYCPSPTIARLGMPYGPGHETGVLSRFVRAALRGEPLVVHRGAARSYTYITDVVDGLLAVIDRHRGQVVDVNNDELERSMFVLAAMIVRLTGSDSPIEITSDHGVHVLRKQPRPNRIDGWNPSVRMEDGLRALIEWERGRL